MKIGDKVKIKTLEQLRKIPNFARESVDWVSIDIATIEKIHIGKIGKINNIEYCKICKRDHYWVEFCDDGVENIDECHFDLIKEPIQMEFEF